MSPWLLIVYMDDVMSEGNARVLGKGHGTAECKIWKQV